MELNFIATDNWQKHADTTNKIVISQGGGRSGKTFSIIQLLIIHAIQHKNCLISIVAENVPFLKRGAIRDFKQIMTSAGMWQESEWLVSKSAYQFKNGATIEFFAADGAGKALGAARDVLFINECNNVNYEIAFQLMARTSGRIWLDYNPRSEFWVHKEIMQNEAYAGMFDYVHSTFSDNSELPEAIKTFMLARAANDDNYRRVYVQGELGNLDGLIFPSFDLIDELPEPAQAYGLDFGYTHDPSALVGVLIQGDTLILDEHIYQTGLRNSDIARIALPIVGRAQVFADSAEPKTIDDLYLAGMNVHPVVKGRDSVMWGLDLMKQYKIKVTKRSIGLIKELRNYTYSKDKEGNGLNQPIDAWNHSIDASRYCVSMLNRQRHEYSTFVEDFNYNEL
jgi:phage terminase large subunit